MDLRNEYIIVVNNIEKKFNGIIEARNKVDELRRKNVKFKIYNLFTIDGVGKPKELSKKDEKFIFKKLHHMTIKKMFREKVVHEKNISKYKYYLNYWKEMLDTVSEETISIVKDKVDMWQGILDIELKAYNMHLEKLYDNHLISLEDKKKEESNNKAGSEENKKEKCNNKEKRRIKIVFGVKYLHKSNIKELTTEELQQVNKCLNVLKEKNINGYNNYKVIRIDEKNGSISFVESNDFNIRHEPTVGNSHKIQLDTMKYKFNPEKSNPQIYHHKHSFVGADYKGFNIEESKKRSKDWEKALKGIKKNSIGYRNQWNELMDSVGLER